MNSWKYHMHAKQVATNAIVKGLNISYVDLYITLKNINPTHGIIETKDGKKYKLVLEEI